MNNSDSSLTAIVFYQDSLKCIAWKGRALVVGFAAGNIERVSYFKFQLALGHFRYYFALGAHEFGLIEEYLRHGHTLGSLQW
jgi:hypothetical protein